MFMFTGRDDASCRLFVFSNDNLQVHASDSDKRTACFEVMNIFRCDLCIDRSLDEQKLLRLLTLVNLLKRKVTDKTEIRKKKTKLGMSR